MIWLSDFTTGEARGIAVDQVAEVRKGGGEWSDRTAVVSKQGGYIWCRETPEQVRYMMEEAKA